MKTASIGYWREDGDFALLATHNNNDDHLPDDVFDRVVADHRDLLQQWIPYQEITVLNREDAPDYVDAGQ